MIEELTMRGFKSYRSRQTVRFTQGVNKISGRNASGKTTLLEAVLFGLFGEVPGVNKQNLVPLRGGKVDVTVILRSPFTGQKVTVHREGGLTKDGNYKTSRCTLKVEGEDHPYVREREIQTRLRELIGVGKRTFFNVVYARQKEFVEILHPQRNRMDAILGLTTPAEIREQFREVKRILGDRGRISERGALEERMRNAEEGIVDCDQQLEEVSAWKAELSEGLEEKKAELTVTRGRVEILEGLAGEFKGLEKTRTELEVLRGRREERERDLEELYGALGERPEERRKELQDRRRRAKTTEERLQRQLDDHLTKEQQLLGGEVSRLEHQVREHRELQAQGLTVCPKCGQKIDYQLLEEDMDLWMKELEAGRKRLADLEREIITVREQVKAAHERWIEVDRLVTRFVDQERQVQRLTKLLRNLDAQGVRLASRLERESEGLLVKAESELAMAFTSLEDAQKKMDESLLVLHKEQTDLQAEIRSREDRLRDAERREKDIENQKRNHLKVLEESKRLLDKILEYEAKIQTMEAIKRQYGEYEQRSRENTLADLEYKTYLYFKRLTDQQIYSSCHIDRERYILEVLPINERRLLPAWRTGGGHESLFALAERLALLRVMGFPHLLILDEPTDAVDSENIPQLLEYIARSSREIGQVLLVTHHGHGEEEGVNLIRVRKRDDESYVVQEAPLLEGAD